MVRCGVVWVWVPAQTGREEGAWTVTVTAYERCVCVCVCVYVCCTWPQKKP
jgi:hypothetical protein